MPIQQSADSLPRQEDMDLFFDSDMVNTLIKTSGKEKISGGETDGLILLEGSYSVIYEDTIPSSPQMT